MIVHQHGHLNFSRYLKTISLYSSNNLFHLEKDLDRGKTVSKQSFSSSNWNIYLKSEYILRLAHL